MFEFLKNIFKSTDYADLIERKVQIVDVRSKGEFSSGNIPSSLNIPLQELAGKIKLLDKSKPVITCCASGMRSASAKAILKANGFEVVNGGSWVSLMNKLQ